MPSGVGVVMAGTGPKRQQEKDQELKRQQKRYHSIQALFLPVFSVGLSSPDFIHSLLVFVYRCCSSWLVKRKRKEAEVREEGRGERSGEGSERNLREACSDGTTTTAAPEHSTQTKMEEQRGKTAGNCRRSSEQPFSHNLMPSHDVGMQTSN